MVAPLRRVNMTETIDTVRTVEHLRARIAAWRAAGETIALVPTMGAIHDGHLSLIALAKAQASRVVASIYVNPTQFGAGEDFSAYPREEARDAQALSSAGCTLLYTPNTNEMYPSGFSTTIHIDGLTEDLCGASRPDHFDGVATVVAKLLLQCAPDKAIFGEKDYQQLLVIKRLTSDLNIPVEIIGAPIVREADGLALSSRNAYLSSDERKTAPMLYQALHQTALDLAQGRGAEDAADAAWLKLEAAGFRLDYLAVRDPETLKPLHGPVSAARVLAAGRLGKTRLIDNVPVPPKA